MQYQYVPGTITGWLSDRLEKYSKRRRSAHSLLQHSQFALEEPGCTHAFKTTCTAEPWTDVYFKRESRTIHEQ